MQYLTMIYNIILAIPKALEVFRAVYKMWLEARKRNQERQNEEVKQEVENATTEEDAQAALDRLSGRFNK